MELTAGRLGCIVLVFLLGYYFGRQARPGRRPAAAKRRRDPADWWKDGRKPPY